MRETAQVSVGGRSYQIEIDVPDGAAAGTHGQRTITMPYAASSKPEAWWARLSAAAIAELPAPPEGWPRSAV